MGRRASREAAVKVLFQLEFQKENPLAQLELFMASDQMKRTVETDYLTAVVKGVIAHTKQIDDLIVENIKKSWTIDRISKIELSILRVCIYELIVQKSVTLEIAANEAVELGKRFGSDTSPAFINGLIGSIGERNGK